MVALGILLICSAEASIGLLHRPDHGYSFSMPSTLPEALTRGASLKDGEYAWSIPSFPDALTAAPAIGFACLGGQFQLRPNPDTIYELFWVEANATKRLASESWKAYAGRSCSEVLEKFTSLLRTVDFREEAFKFKSFDSWLTPDRSLSESLVFNAYFVDEPEFGALRRAGVEL